MIDGLRAAVDGESFLARRNPSIKLVVVLGYVLAASVLVDLRVLLLLTVLALVAARQLGRVPLRALGRALLPFAVLGLGYLWINLLFSRAGAASSDILAQAGPVSITRHGLENGLVVLVRALCVGACSALFVATTDAADFAMSLAQQLRLSPRVAYGIVAAYRMLPGLHDALAQIRVAHRLRGVGDRGGMRGRIEQAQCVAIPLLASAIRDAGRIAIAMESRAFSGDRRRTWRREQQITATDVLFMAGAGAALMAVICISGSSA